jgi:5-methylcytosine-specific restriction endonuclease McrA
MPIKPELRHLYPKNWKEIRQRILERANDCCEFCGVPNHSWVSKISEADGLDCGYRIVLTIAHLDHDPTHNDPSNLRALCQTCHNRHDAKHRAANRSHTAALKRDKSEWIDFK